MKIAVAALQKDENAEISNQAGRSPFFLVFDAQNTLLEVLKNPFSIGGGGAGFGVAKMLADKEVTNLIAGKIGGNMRDALEERGIHFHEMKGTVTEAISQYRKH